MSRSVRVLHVDDDPDFAELAATFLEREDDCFEVVTEHRAQDGLARLAEESFDCIVSDYDMPGLNGLEFLDAVREEYTELPFILFTGKGSEEIASEAISAGVTDYLQKETGSDQYTVLANRIRQSIDRRRAVQRFEHSRERYRRLVETMPEPIIVHDTEEILYANPAAVEFAAADSADDLIGSPPMELIHPDDRERLSRQRRPIHDSETSLPDEVESVDVELRCLTVDGEVRHAVARGTPIVYEDEECAQVVFRDVTERKEREQELRRNERRFEAVFNDPESLIGLLDTDGTLLQANDTALDIVDADPGDVEGEPFPETPWWAQFRERGARLRSWIERAADGEFIREEVTNYDDEGKSFATDFSLWPVRDETGDVTSLIAEGRDITQRKRAEQLFRSLFEHIPDPASLVQRKDGVPIIQDVNAAFEETFGYDATDAIGESIDNLIVPSEHIDEAREINQRVGEGDQIKRIVSRQSADGSVREFLFRNAWIRTNGEREMHFGVYTDVTERIEREREVELFRQLIDHSNDSVYVIDPETGAFEDVNETACERLGYERDELLDLTIADIDETGISEHLDSRVDVVREQGQLQREITHRRKDGTTFPVEIGVSYVELDHGDYLLAIGRDIRERKEAERILTALHTAAADLGAGDTVKAVCEDTIDAAQDILEFGRSTVYIEKNGSLTRIAASESGTDERVEQCSSQERLVEKTFQTSESVMIGERTEELTEYQGPAESVLSIPIDDHGVFLAGADEPDAFTETHLELAELLISHTESVLDRLDREHRLQRQNERLDEFASIVSHDLKSPLNVALGHVELMADEKASESLDKIEAALKRMDRIIDDVLTMARQSQPVDTTEQVQLAETIERAWKYVQTDEATLEVLNDLSFAADRSRLQQILENLLANAVRHGGSDVSIRVGTHSDGFYLEDDGPGIPPEIRDEVFEPGFSTTDEGIGFGLNIVERMVNAHDWAITITEGTGGGARFEISGISAES